MNLFIFIIAVVSVSLNALAQVAIRKTMLSVAFFPGVFGEYFRFVLSLLTNPWFIVGMGAYVLSIGLWMAVLSKLEVSLAYPLLSLGYIITAIIGYFFLDENINAVRLVGLLLICVGIIFISRSA